MSGASGFVLAGHKNKNNNTQFIRRRAVTRYKGRRRCHVRDAYMHICGSVQVLVGLTEN